MSQAQTTNFLTRTPSNIRRSTRKMAKRSLPRMSPWSSEDLLPWSNSKRKIKEKKKGAPRCLFVSKMKLRIAMS